MPTGIRHNGFFSDQASSIATKIKTEYKQLFFYLAEANEQAHKYLAKLEVNQDLKELVAAALLARVLTAYQSLIILTERGFASEAKAVCRNILEARFKLGFLVEEPKAAEMMLAKYGAERIKRLEKYKEGKLPVHKDAGNPDWQKLIDAAKARQENLIGPKGRNSRTSAKSLRRVGSLAITQAATPSSRLLPTQASENSTSICNSIPNTPRRRIFDTDLTPAPGSHGAP
jgi:Family of unknown function (DUF5677)